MGYFGTIPNFTNYDYTQKWAQDMFAGVLAAGVQYIKILDSDDELVFHAQFYMLAAADTHLSEVALVRNWDTSSFTWQWGFPLKTFAQYELFGLTNSRRYQVIVNTDGICGFDLDFPTPIKLLKDETLWWRVDNNAGAGADYVRSLSRSYGR